MEIFLHHFCIISRTTNKNKLHILFWDDEFFDETIKTLYEQESVQTCLKANKTILKDDAKFRKLFEQVKSTGHKWWDASACDKSTCSICKRRYEHELTVLKSLQLDDIIIFKENNQTICGKILEMDSIINGTRQVHLLYKTWINSTMISRKEKTFTITGNVENITSIIHKHYALNHSLI